MPIFRFSVAVISAAKGASAVRSAAYRHAARMTSEVLNETRSYEGKAKEVVYSEVAVPGDLADWADAAFGSVAFEKALREVRTEAQVKDIEMSDQEVARLAWARISERLWNSVEDGERRLNRRYTQARYARSLTIALPAELEREQQITLMQGYVAAAFTGRGMVADWVIHDKLDGNPHVHVMLTTREIGASDWGKKQRAWNDKSLLAGWRSDWARHANLALERAGFDARIDHRTNAARGIYLEPEGYNPHVAEHARRRGDVAREATRCQDVRQRNAAFLRDNPEHILVVLQSQRAVFTAGDVRTALQERMVFGADQGLDALVREVMGSGHLVELVQKSPEGDAQYITASRAAEIQRLWARSREMASGQLALAAPKDPFESGTGPILIEIASEGRKGDERQNEHRNEQGRQATSADAALARGAGTPRRGRPDQGRGAGAGGQNRGATQKVGPGVDAVREALSVWAEDLFRASFGEPVASRAAEWRARESGAITMKMRGPSRGLWIDHSSGEGGDLLDLVARTFCGLSAARDDFPEVMAEAIRFTGLSKGEVNDLAAQATRRQARENAAAAEDAREDVRKAALVKSLVDQVLPIEDSPAAGYLAARGITAVPTEGLGWLPPQPASGSQPSEPPLGPSGLVLGQGVRPGRGLRSPEHGALVIWARNEAGEITGGQRILVNGDGTGVDIEVRKPAFGSISGSPARFPARVMEVDPQSASGPPPALGSLVIAEGPESALSIWQATGYETWAVFGVSGWKSAPVPQDRPVIFAPDRDEPDSPAGRAFRSAVAQHVEAGCDVRVAVAPEASGSKRDLNDTDQRAGPDAVRGSIAAARPVGSVPAVGSLLSAKLNPDQRAAAEAMLSSASLTLIKGHAGTGKTWTLGEVTRVWQARGYEVLGGAPSGKATQELSGIEGMRTASLAAWEARWARGERLPQDRFIFVMDEAGMVGAGQWTRIADRVAAMGGKLIAVGDPEQLQPVSDLPGWEVVERAVAAEAGSMAVMGAVMRQRDLMDRMATEALARGGASSVPAIKHYVNKGALRLEKDVLDDPIKALAEAYYQTGVDRDRIGVSVSRIALAYTNRDVWALNAAIRAQALECGEIDRSAVRNYGSITRIDRSGEIHERIEVPLELGPGDRIMLTRPHRALGLPRSAFGTVVATREDEIDLLVDGGGRPVTIDLKTFRDLDYGYGATIHKSQGLTVDYALVLGHGRLMRHAVYVALTRHRVSVTVFGHPKYLTRPADLIRLAQTPGHLSVDMEDGSDRLSGSMVAGAEVLGLGARGDWLGSGVTVEDDRATGQVSFLGDVGLMAVAERVAGLLASEYIQGDPILKEGAPAGIDAKGYAQEPTRVIDDLIARRSVFKADDVAGALSQVVAEPETFLRLFREAMAHPDLVVLSEDGPGGEGRVYSTAAQLRSELAAVDMGTRLALAGPMEVAPAMEMRAGDRAGLTAAQMAALEHGAQGGRLRLIRGDAGSGKTLVAARLAAAHRRAGWQVIGLTPTGAGLDALWDAGFRDGRTLTQFARECREGRLQLDPLTVVVLDDAGRLGGREAGQLLEAIEASGAKLVALMDGGVQVPLEAGPVLRAIEVRVGSARLEDMQGRRPEMAEALRAVAAGDGRGIDALLKQNVIHAGGTAQGAAAALATRYLMDQSGDKIALAWSRPEVALLTKAIRAGLDATDEARAGFAPEAEGAFAGLKPGDHIRFVASTPWQQGRPAKDAPPRIRAGERGELLGRDKEGQLHLRLEGRLGRREVIFTPDAEIPDWRFDFASSIHGEMGRAHGSVHLLASVGMNRQVMAAGMNLHLGELSVTMPCAAQRLPEVMAGILRRDASAPSVMDYGFESSLGAREALRGHVYEADGFATFRAVERLRELAGLAGFASLAGLAGLTGSGSMPAHKALPRGMEGEVLAEVIGAMILHEGSAPEGSERLAVERVVADISDPRAWRKLLRQVPGSLPVEADDLARRAAGTDGEGLLLTPARIMARGALIGRALGEDRVATLFERGLVLYGKRAEAARLLGRPEDLVPPQRARMSKKEWPDPSTRPERPQRGLRGHRPAQHQRKTPVQRVKWRLDIARLLGDTPRAEQVIAEQVLEDMFGLGRKGARSRGAAQRYAAWRAGSKTRAAAQSTTQVLGRLQNQDRKAVPEITPAVAQPKTQPKTRAKTHPGPWDKAPPVPAVPGRDYAGMGLQLAQAISERVDVHSPVQDMDLPLSLEALVRAADPGPKFNFTDEAIFARISKLPRLEGEIAALAGAVEKALTEGPLDNIATLRAERVAILKHLGAPEAPRFAAKEFVPRLRSFTHNELWAMNTPTAAWPGSLPPRAKEDRQRIAQSFGGYADKFEKETKMQNAEQSKGIRDEMVKKLALGRVDAQSMEVIEKVFSLDEIMALMDPKAALPDSLPSMPQAARENIANTLQRVSRGEIAGAGGSGPSPAPAPQVRIAPEYATLGLQLACAITDRVDASSAVHKLPLQAQISQLLKQAAARSDLPQDKVDQIARGIAKDRAVLESKIAFAKELIAGAPPPTLQGKLPEYFNEHLFLSQIRQNGGYDQNEHPMRGNYYPLQERFTHEVDGCVARDLAAGTAEPTKEEYLVARMSLLPDRSKAEVKVSEALSEALKWGRVIDAKKLHEERIKLPAALASVGDIESLDAENLVARVYRSFTYPEIMALADPERALPKTMGAMDDALRASAARGFAKSTNVTQNTLLIFPWKDHAVRHGLGAITGAIDEPGLRDVDGVKGFMAAAPLFFDARCQLTSHSLLKNRPCCMDVLLDETRPTHGFAHDTRANPGRPSSVILLRTVTPILTSVFWLSRRRAFNFGPMTLFHRPICVSTRLRLL